MLIMKQANSAYVAWVVAFNATFLLLYLATQVIAQKMDVPADQLVPPTFEYINRNGLAIFLVVRLTSQLYFMLSNL